MYDSGKLPDDVLKLINDDENDVYISLISLWEIELKHGLRPDNMTYTAKIVKEDVITMGYIILHLAAEHIEGINLLEMQEDGPDHKDPFDRLQLSQSKAEDMYFVTADAKLPYYKGIKLIHFNPKN